MAMIADELLKLALGVFAFGLVVLVFYLMG